MQPNPIRTDTNDFANNTFARRLPQMIRDIQGNNQAYSVKVHAALDELYEQLTSNAPLPPPPLTAPDAQTWLEAYQQHKAETWQSTEFLYGETYFFHLVNEIVQYWQTNSDPYKEQKDEEFYRASKINQHELSQKLIGSPEEKLSQLIPMSLWGNRADLSLPEVMKNQTQSVAAEDLLIDDCSQAIDHILTAKGTLHFITDNYGTELLMDCFLIDTLLSLSISVTVHVKMHPTYVSDATADDLFSMINVFREHRPTLFSRLHDAWVDGRLQVAPNFFWNSPHFLDKLPAPLMQLFADASLLIFKGDVNYRRAFFDTIWPVDMPASEIVNYLPAPALFLRTVKSDCLAGVPKVLAEKAQAANPNWRRLGKYGVIQYINVSSHT